MADKINNIHDKFVRESFSDPARAIAFFERFLPEKIVASLDLSTLEVIKESYMTNTLQEFFSDLVFEIAIKEKQEEKINVALLFEHKSSVDKYVLVQVGHYMFAHWFNCVSEKKPLQVIIPIIYYQGKQEWKVANFRSLFNDLPDSIKDFIPELKYLFYAINSISEDKIETMRDAMMSAALIAQNGVSTQSNYNQISLAYLLFSPKKVSIGTFSKCL